MIEEETLTEIKIKSIKDLEVLAKKLKKKIIVFENRADALPSDAIKIAHAITLLISEYRHIKRDIIEILIK